MNIMNTNEPLGRSHFVELYFQAAKVRENELASFFSRYAQGADSGVTSAQLDAASLMAGEIQEYLQRASIYMNEAARLGESHLQRQ